MYIPAKGRPEIIQCWCNIERIAGMIDYNNTFLKELVRKVIEIKRITIKILVISTFNNKNKNWASKVNQHLKRI